MNKPAHTLEDGDPTLAAMSSPEERKDASPLLEPSSPDTGMSTCSSNGTSMAVLGILNPEANDTETNETQNNTNLSDGGEAHGNKNANQSREGDDLFPENTTLHLDDSKYAGLGITKVTVEGMEDLKRYNLKLIMAACSYLKDVSFATTSYAEVLIETQQQGNGVILGELAHFLIDNRIRPRYETLNNIVLPLVHVVIDHLVERQDDFLNL